ncbi:MAG TPA: polymer-forming cytoskeletal protein [Woeseiaceae bacterium]|nr:polymer-forming cytoskeletal protein [Woeseiaceae bacterium]
MNETRLRRLRDFSSGPATLISDGCTITGELSGHGDFMISGEVHGDSDLDGTVTLTRNGFWKGRLKASAVIVAGTVEGDIVASGHVEIGDTATIRGTVTGEAIAVAEGAVVEGSMKTTGKGTAQAFVEKRSSD